jgi:hypothetical protein
MLKLARLRDVKVVWDTTVKSFVSYAKIYDICNKTYQYSETNVIHFLFNLLKIKSLYIFRALLAHPQEVLNKRQLIYCVCVMSVGCTNPSAAN